MNNKSKVFHIGKMVAYLCPCGTAHANGEHSLCTACEKEAAQQKRAADATKPCDMFQLARDGKCYNCGFDEESHR